jgi:RNA 2',3'-cyclic 3'-phosphodiesterase
MPRLFVALRPPAAIRNQLIAAQGGVDGARWQDDGQLHLTLRYIGEVNPRAGDEVLLALSAIRATPFGIALNGVGTFDHKGRIDTLWAGVSPHEPLAALHKKIDHALVRVGLPPEGRAYNPHVTLARGRIHAPVAPFLAANALLASSPFTVTHFGLYESSLGRDGAGYTLVERWPLG